MDLYAAATNLLTLIGAQLVSDGVTLPTQRFVGAGPLPVWDTDQLAVHLVRTFTGQPGAENPVQGQGFSLRSAEFAVSIVRTVPMPDDYGVIPTQAVMAPHVQTNMSDVAALQRGMEALKQAGTWVDHPNPFGIGACTTQGPEGAMLAAVITAQIVVLS